MGRSIFAAIYEALEAVVPLKTIIENTSGRARKIEGLKDESALMKGKWLEKPTRIAINGAIYMEDLAHGQKTRLLFDQRANHAFGAYFA